MFRCSRVKPPNVDLLQAFVHKHLGGRNRGSFAPSSLQDPEAVLCRLDPSTRAKFAEVQVRGGGGESAPHSPLPLHEAAMCCCCWAQAELAHGRHALWTARTSRHWRGQAVTVRVCVCVHVQGLGKIVLTNIRTPKILMDLSATAPSMNGSAEVRM